MQKENNKNILQNNPLDYKTTLREVIQQLESETKTENRFNPPLILGEIEYYEWKKNLKLNNKYKEFLLIHNGAEYPRYKIIIFGIGDLPNWCSLENAKGFYKNYYDENKYSLIGKSDYKNIILMNEKGQIDIINTDTKEIIESFENLKSLFFVKLFENNLENNENY